MGICLFQSANLYTPLLKKTKKDSYLGKNELSLQPV